MWVILNKHFITDKLRDGKIERRLPNGQALLRVTKNNEEYLTNYIKYNEETLPNLNEETFLHPSEISSSLDPSGREITRVVVNTKGWTFLAKFVDVTTSTLDSIYCEDSLGNQETQHYCKFYDENNNELTTQTEIDTSCVKSVFTIIPNEDIEIVSGEVHQHERPTTNLRLHTLVGAFDSNGNSLSSKSFVQNLNMKFKDKAKTIVTDGRAPKMLKKDFAGLPFDANQIQIILHHDSGLKHELMVEIEYYRK